MHMYNEYLHVTEKKMNLYVFGGVFLLVYKLHQHFPMNLLSKGRLLLKIGKFNKEI